MRYLLQAVIIAAVTFAAELIKYFVPLPVPASIYGLLLLFALVGGGLALLAYAAVRRKTFVNTGFLSLPLCPVYGHPEDAPAGAGDGIYWHHSGNGGHGPAVPVDNPQKGGKEP